MPETVDYTYKPDGAGAGKFLNLKSKGDKVVIRLADKPIVYFVHWVNKDGKEQPVPCEKVEDCKVCQWLATLSPEQFKKQEIAKKRRRQVFLWSVIDRKDGEAKIFKAGINIFLEIAELANNPDWGGPNKDATLFDIEITRTETSLQNYYSVVPKPASLSEKLTAKEKAAVVKLMPLIDAVIAGKELPTEAEEKDGKVIEKVSEDDQSAKDIASAVDPGARKEETVSDEETDDLPF